MNILTQKVILIISPQPWNFIHISKHHYALELCKNNNIVYFLNPPTKISKITINKNNEVENLYIIDYYINCPYWLRFKIKFLFDLLMRIQIKQILNELPQKPNIVWSFEPNLFSNLKLFKTNIIIYHPVDLIIFPYQIKLAKTAQVVFSVSKPILKKISPTKVPAFFINHGLSEDFKKLAERNSKEPQIKKSNKISVGYIGNLLIHSLNYSLFKLIVTENKTIEFNFWGPYQVSEGVSDETKDFILFLKTSENVILHGVKPPQEIVKEMNNIDAFMMFYLFNKLEYDRSNSHKILEYLSTGKVIISNYVELYASYPELICMPKDNDDSKLSELFHFVMENIDYFNNPSLQKERIELALENTYSKQLAKIDNILISEKIVHI
jgi:hypothetical protein